MSADTGGASTDSGGILEDSGEMSTGSGKAVPDTDGTLADAGERSACTGGISVGVPRGGQAEAGITSWRWAVKAVSRSGHRRQFSGA
jgi:hypothetical protein